jgi:hypothetical protein
MAGQRRRRANRDSAQWAELIAAWRASGLSGREFADAYDIGVGSLYGWSARLDSEAPEAPRSPAFSEVHVIEAARASTSPEEPSARIELVARWGRVIRVVGAVDADTLGVVLEVAERC